MKIAPRTNANGSADVTVTVSDGAKTGSVTFNVLINPVNDAPSISFIPNEWKDQFETAVIQFGVGDVDSDVSALSVSATSSNQGIVPDANLEIGGSDAYRTITVVPADGLQLDPGMYFDTSITIEVGDETAVATRTFSVLWKSLPVPLDAGPGTDSGDGATDDADSGAPAEDAGPHAGEHDSGAGGAPPRADGGHGSGGATGHGRHDAGAGMQCRCVCIRTRRQHWWRHGRSGRSRRRRHGRRRHGVSVNDDCGCSTIGASRPPSRVVLSALLGLLGLASRR